jgi:type IV pilus biogenesis protein CpaD/CtpE
MMLNKTLPSHSIFKKAALALIITGLLGGCASRDLSKVEEARTATAG